MTENICVNVRNACIDLEACCDTRVWRQYDAGQSTYVPPGRRTLVLELFSGCSVEHRNILKTCLRFFEVLTKIAKTLT